MELTIRTHHASAEDGFREHAEKKLARLERLLPNLDDVVIELEREETRAAVDRYGVKVVVHAGAVVLRAEERAADATAALDAAADALSHQARRHKQRTVDRHHPQGAKERMADAVNMAPVAEPDSADDDGAPVAG